jgi:hypothetical protein
MAGPPVSRTWLAPRTLPTGADEAGGTAVQSSASFRTTSGGRKQDLITKQRARIARFVDNPGVPGDETLGICDDCAAHPGVVGAHDRRVTAERDACCVLLRAP